MCRLPNFFRCDVVSVNESRKLGAGALSVTRVNGWLACQRRWALHYVYKLRPAVEPEWATLGKQFAVARARVDAGLEYELDLTPLSHDAGVKLTVLMEEYTKRRPMDGNVVSEVKIAFTAFGCAFLGYADAISRDGGILYEWKYAQDDYDLPKVARQLATYFYGTPTAHEAVLLVAQKTRHKSKKGETTDQFLDRVRKEYAATPDLFARQTFRRTDLDVPGLVAGMAAAKQQMDAAVAQGTFLPNLGSMTCLGCEWQQLCRTHLHVDLFAHDPAACATAPLCTRLPQKRCLPGV